MNGEVVCSTPPFLSCSKSLLAVQGEKANIRLTQEGRHSPVGSLQSDAPRPTEGRTADTNSVPPRHSKAELPDSHGGYSQCSPCWPDEQPSPPQLHWTQTSLRPPPDTARLLSKSLSPAPLHSNNGDALRAQQRRGALAIGRGKKTSRRTRMEGKNSQNRKVTDYYPIRRSSRKSKTELKCERKKLIDELIIKGIEEGMEVQYIEGKGRAVFATRCFQKGDYVVEYHGDLLQITDAKKREAEYAENPATGCYMYYFQYLCKTYCVDATKETGRMGRLINHSKTGNCQTKLHDINGTPHLILVASRDIDKGEELLYDYGDRSKASIAAHPWLKY
ncbi:N-lysine methyltransferase SETD8-A [Oryzias melastigma]|uniref:[histone H4]-lysine(20) N-methyltransferase n=1 Tax=Oryzias melastigma TaxID=30732 RepID=A0A834CBL5_ORYME|nr:N-lysine methyltransferase SETD8-A [Oryzias melastigma]